MSIYLLFFYFITRYSVCSKTLNDQDFGIDLKLNFDAQSTEENLNSLDKDRDEIYYVQFYYESLSPESWLLYTFFITPLVEQQGSRVRIATYPYGNAKTYTTGGIYTFKCEHGPKECYGNMLHACALQLMDNKLEAITFNSCLMNHQSNDAAVDKCAHDDTNLAEGLKLCAISRMGPSILKYYGDESKKAHYNTVPYILINGEPLERKWQEIAKLIG